MIQKALYRHNVSFGEFLFNFLLKRRTKIHQILTLCSLPSCQADVSWAKVQCRQVYLVVAASAHWYNGVQIIQKILQCGALVLQRCVSCPLVLVHVLVHLHFNLVISVLAQFQIGQPSWCDMVTELRPSFQNRNGRPMISQLEEMKRPIVSLYNPPQKKIII